MTVELRVPSPDYVDIHPDRWTQPFWDAAAEHRLVCASCGECGALRIPPGPFCPRCQSQEIQWAELRGLGVVFTYTVVHHPVMPELADGVPYAVAAVDLDDAPGIRLLANLVSVDSEDLRVGMRVEIEWADIREGISLPRFRPTISPSAD
jgi:uncharacterized protein